jgi:hypothetical protein
VRAVDQEDHGERVAGWDAEIERPVRRQCPDRRRIVRRRDRRSPADRCTRRPGSSRASRRVVRINTRFAMTPQDRTGPARGPCSPAGRAERHPNPVIGDG